MKYLSYILVFLFLVQVCMVQAEAPNPTNIIKKCIAAHGGEKNFNDIHDIYAKLLLKSYSKDGIFENTLYEYYRLPHFIRMDILPPQGAGISISWDGNSMYQYANNQQQKSDKKEDVDQMQESLRFMKLLILTNLLKSDSKLKYEQYQAKKNIHVISQTDAQGEKVWLLIDGKTFRLCGAKFFLAGEEEGNKKAAYNVLFVEHHQFAQLVLPREARLYRGSELVMEAKISLAKTNIIENGNDFFSNLSQKPLLKKETKRNYRQ